MYGKMKCKLTLGDLTLDVDVIVAEIDDEGLLGIDVLQKHYTGPADILLSKGEIHLSGHKILCIQIGGQIKVRKVRAADHYMIQGKCEQIIDVLVERQMPDYYSDKCEVIIEPSTEFTETYPLLMAPTVVDLNRGATQKVRVLNPFDTEVSIKQDSVVGLAETFSNMKTLVQTEDETESGNYCSVRRIKSSDESACIRTAVSSNHETGSMSEQIIPTHLKKLYDDSIQGKTEKEKQSIANLLIKYQDVFSKTEFDLGRTHLGEHVIDTGDAKPIKQRPRRVPIAFADQEEKVIKQMEEQKIIRKSNSPWASPLCLVMKPNGKVRPCIDYRAVNKLTEPDCFPIPNTKDCLDAFAGAKLFSTFDLTAGYHQVPVMEKDIPKTAFISKYGLYEHLTMPMGMMNSGATFQRIMETALRGLQWLICLIYLDDVCVFGKDFDEHIHRVEQVLSRMRDAGLKLKPEKCHLLKTEVNFLSFTISERGILPSPHNVAKF